MKKSLIVVGALIACFLSFQFYVANKIDNALEKTELNKTIQQRVISWLEKLKELGEDDENFNKIFANLDENFIKQNIQIIGSQNDKGLFGSNATIELSAGSVLFEIKAQTSYLFGNFKAKGQILPKDNKAVMIIQKAFKNSAPFTFTYDDKLTLNMAGLDFSGKRGNFTVEPLWLSAGQKDDLLDFGFGILGAYFDNKRSKFTLKNAQFAVHYKGLEQEIKNIVSNTFLNIDEVSFLTKKLDFDLLNFKFKENSNIKESMLFSDLELRANRLNLELKNQLPDLAISDIAIKSTFSKLDFTNFKKDKISIFTNDSKINFDEISLKIAEQKIAAKLSISLDPSYDKSKINEIYNFILLKGSFSSQKELSKIFPQFAILASFEQDFIKNGYLKKSNEGYETSFDGRLDKLIFNKEKELNVAKLLKK